MEVLDALGRAYLTLREILATISFNEFSYVSVYEQDYKLSEEALGRQLFYWCGPDGICEGDQLWQFLGGFQGWYFKGADKLIFGMSFPKGRITAERIFTESSWRSGWEYTRPFVFGNTTLYPNARSFIESSGMGTSFNQSYVLNLDVSPIYIVWSPEQRQYWESVEDKLRPK